MSIIESDGLNDHGSDFDDGIPTVDLLSSDTTAEIVQRLQLIVLKHPIAANAAFGALVAEGLAFAETPEGLHWRDKLVGSELLHRARLALDLPGLSMLERNSGQALPSAYLDAIFTLTSRGWPEELFNPQFGGLSSDVGK
jgi:hypothetical protein